MIETTEMLVKTMESILEERTASQAKEREEIESLNAVLERMGYRIVPIRQEPRKRRSRGRGVEASRGRGPGGPGREKTRAALEDESGRDSTCVVDVLCNRSVATDVCLYRRQHEDLMFSDGKLHWAARSSDFSSYVYCHQSNGERHLGCSVVGDEGAPGLCWF